MVIRGYWHQPSAVSTPPRLSKSHYQFAGLHYGCRGIWRHCCAGCKVIWIRADWDSITAGHWQVCPLYIAATNSHTVNTWNRMMTGTGSTLLKTCLCFFELGKPRTIQKVGHSLCEESDTTLQMLRHRRDWETHTCTLLRKKTLALKLALRNQIYQLWKSCTSAARRQLQSGGFSRFSACAE